MGYQDRGTEVARPPCGHGSAGVGVSGLVRCLAIFANLLVLCALPQAVFAQSASQITPQSFAPPIQSGPGGGIDVGAPPGLDTPAGAERLFVTLRGVRIEGGLPPLAATEAAIRSSLLGRRVSGAEIFAAARALEAAYAKAGYVLVRVTLPQQKLVDGAVLRLLVIDGYIERVETRELPDRVRARIGAVMAPIVGRRGVMLRDLERRILLAGDTPGVILRSTLAPGQAIGATVLVIEAHYQPVNVLVTADNTLSEALGHYQVGIGADFNSVLGFGELVYLRATAAPELGQNGFLSDDPRNRILAAGVIVPIGTNGLTFNAEGTLARTTPLAADQVQSTDQFQRLSFRLRYPWIRSRDFNFASQVVLDVEDERLSLLAGSKLPLSQDRVRALRLLNEANYLAPWGGTFVGTLTPSVGLDVLGARTAADATALLPLSRQGADATFAKLEGTFGYSRSFAEHLTGSLSADAQTSFGSALVRAEQIGLAGPAALSAYDVGTLQGDSGFVGRAELAAPFTLPPIPVLSTLDPAGVGIVAAPYVFGAGGEYFLAHPTAQEFGHVRVAAFGAGLRLAGGPAGSLSNGAVTLEYGRQVARSDGMRDDNRFTLVSAIRF